MNLNVDINRKKFLNNGYFTIKNFFNKKEISIINNEIIKSKKTEIYKDSNNKIRRIEKFYKKGKFLREINDRFIDLIRNILKLKVLIFKDKYNVKPPYGEGFFAHYDGIFYFKNVENKIKKGWYEYGNLFINVLVAIDNCNSKNGTIELAKSHKNNFEKLIKNTKNDGTPILLEKIEKKNSFKKMNLKSGDLVIFSNTCPHRSKKNRSKYNRRIMYYTYLDRKFGSQYNAYFKDKKLSKNKSSKSLSGEK